MVSANHASNDLNYSISKVIPLTFNFAANVKLVGNIKRSKTIRDEIHLGNKKHQHCRNSNQQ